ncbi:MAG: DNA translocase FtsK [Candidatus Omnitrophica bacterium]|nr:DNA translocase FtsK [Candidatus Omnitrophota bacterium]
MKERRLNEIKGVVLVAAALIIFASLISFDYLDLSFYTSHPNIPAKNFIRTFGAYLGWFLIFLFGRATSFIIPLFIFWLGIRIFRQRLPYLRLPQVIGFVLLLFSLSSLIGISISNETTRFLHSGLVGSLLSSFFLPRIGLLGGYIAFITLGLLSFVLATEMLISTFFLNLGERLKAFLKSIFDFKKKARPLVLKPVSNGRREPAPSLAEAQKPKITEIPSKAPSLTSAPKIKIKEALPAPALESRARLPELKIGDYHLPGLDLLDSPPPLEARQIKEDLAANARILEETLEDFSISAKVTDVERGPVITRYELEPAPGVKVNRIVALSDDIALSMKAQSVRIIAPIPGKGRVGVEVPNMQSSLVYFKETIASNDFQKSGSKLSLALGKDITGQPVITDLGDMPHLLIAGTTGSGKTVCVNCLILSMLFRSTPNELKFLMIDPKMVELAPFNGLPHLLCPVVTDAKKAAVGLGWVVNEMEERYRLLAKVGARNIDAYNEKQEKIPYIVVIVDELADLMMVARDQIESAITRLAQLSRAVGIHLILATQRPSVDVITGVIKANFPARISFKVASKVDSRTVLDMNGADKLLGRGDMLFLRPGESKLIRAQGSLVNDKEIERVVAFIKSQAEPVYDEEILKEQQKSGLVNGEKDDLYDQAVRVIMESNQASVSILQRRLRLGYTRSARIIDMMEQEGLIGPFEGSKPRRILADRGAWLEETLTEKEKQ